MWINVSVDSEQQPLWIATWQDDEGHFENLMGSERDVLAWARQVPATGRLIFSAQEGDWLPWE